MKIRNRRRYPRINQSFRTYLLFLDNKSGKGSELPLDFMVEAQTLDISEEGIQITTGCALGIGTYVVVVVFTGEQKSICFCRIMWKKRDRAQFRYGLYFKEWSYLDSRLEQIFPKKIFGLLRWPLNLSAAKKAA